MHREHREKGLRPDRATSRRHRWTASAVVLFAVSMWPGPAAAARPTVIQENPVVDLQQAPDGDVRVQTTLLVESSSAEVDAVFQAVQDAMLNDPDVRNNPCAAVTVVIEGGNTISRPSPCNPAGARPTGSPCTASNGQQGVMGTPYQRPFNGVMQTVYPCIVTPPTPAPPGWTLPPFTVTCGVSAFVVETAAHGYSPTTRRTQHEVEWRPAGEADWRPLGYSSDVMVRMEGEPDGGETIEARVRGRAAQRTRSSGRYSPWSAYGAWTAWTEGTAPAPCPTPESAPVDLDACRDGTLVRVWWTARIPLDPATLPLAGWQVETTDRTVTLTDNLNADARSVERTLQFTNTAWDVTVWALVGPGSGVLGSLPATIQVTSSTTACPSPPSAPAAPPVFADPSPTMTCGPTTASAWWPGWALWEPTGWEREEQFEAEVLDSGGVWQPLSTSVDSFGRWQADSAPAPGSTVAMRIRGQGRHREQHAGLWSPWSAWSAWSSWSAHTTPICPPPPAPATLADPSPALTCGRATFDGVFLDWADNAPTGWERESEYEAEYEDTASVWQSLALTKNGSRYEFSGPSDPGNAVDVRVRARGRQRQRVSGVWSAWSAWNAWSTQYAHSTRTCLLPPPPTPPPPSAPAPTGVAVGCTASAGIFTAQAAWAAPPSTMTMEYLHTVSWSVEDANGVITAYTTGPIYVRTAAITSVSQTLGAGDVATVSVTTWARARALVGGFYSAWSPLGAASAAATATDPTGCPTGGILQPCPGDPTQKAAVWPAGFSEPYTDYDGNGSWDPGEPFIDHDRDLTWTADLGGVLTGQCFPPGHICLQPGEVCLAMGS